MNETSVSIMLPLRYLKNLDPKEIETPLRTKGEATQLVLVNGHPPRASMA